MPHWMVLVAGVPLAIVLRIAGYVDTVWTVFAIGAVIFIWGWLLQTAPLFRGRNFVIAAGIVLMLSTGLLGTVARDLIETTQTSLDSYLGMSGKAARRALLARDLEMFLQINPEMLYSRREAGAHLQDLEDRLGAEDAKKLAQIRSDLDKGLLSMEQAQTQTMSVIKEINKNSQKSEELKNGLAQRGQTNKSALRGVGIVGSILGGVLLILVLVFGTRMPARGFFGFLGGLLLLGGLAAGLVHWQFSEVERGGFSKSLVSSAIKQNAEEILPVVVPPRGQVYWPVLANPSGFTAHWRTTDGQPWGKTVVVPPDDTNLKMKNPLGREFRIVIRYPAGAKPQLGEPQISALAQ